MDERTTLVFIKSVDVQYGTGFTTAIALRVSGKLFFAMPYK